MNADDGHVTDSDSKPTPAADASPPAPPAAEPVAVASSRARVPVARAALVVGLVVLALVAIDYGTAAPAICASCHDTDRRVARWAESTHSEVACVSCHQPPTAWYALPQRLVARTRLLTRDAWWQCAGRSETSTKTPAGVLYPVSNENCLQCHDPRRPSTSGFRILIDHAEHAERNGTCLSCHVKTAHPDETRGTAISLMDQCFNCHGTAEQPEAKAGCRVCHPRDYKLLPASHEPAAWERGDHAKVAAADRDQCDLCHMPAFCTDCHGVEMPHPAGWGKGEPAGHAVVAARSRQTCSRCHTEKPDLCSMCHHRGWEPAEGTWIDQHPLMVRQRGAAFCFDCHVTTLCFDCHIKFRGPRTN